MEAQMEVFGQQVKLQHIYLWQLQLQAKMEALGQVQYNCRWWSYCDYNCIKMHFKQLTPALLKTYLSENNSIVD